MSVIPMQAAQQLAQPPQVDTELAHEALTPQFAWSANALASKAAAADSAAEAKDFADAALKCVQAIITLDPTRLQGGDTADARKAATPEPQRARAPRTPATSDGDRDGRIGE